MIEVMGIGIYVIHKLCIYSMTSLDSFYFYIFLHSYWDDSFVACVVFAEALIEVIPSSTVVIRV